MQQPWLRGQFPSGRKYAKIGYTDDLPTLPIQQYPSASTQSKGDKPMSDERPGTPAPGSEAQEQPVLLIPLALDITEAEISGLAWAGDELIILPQYPNWQKTPGDGMVMALPKAEILSIIDYRTSGALTPRPVPFISGGLETQIKGFEGFESIAIQGDRVYVTIEASPDHQMMGYLVAGTLAPDLSELRLDPARMAAMPTPANIPNASYETVFIVGDRIVTLYEENGAALNPHPIGRVFDLDLHELGTIPFPNIEYRVTDASEPDEAGRFWVMNFIHTGRKAKFQAAPDPLITRYGMGRTHALFDAVERLVQFQYAPDGITLVDRPPLQLQLLDPMHGRNWEGLVNLDDRGFLIITDRFPVAMLGFVPLPQDLG
jgi:hypothetical protein